MRFIRSASLHLQKRYLHIAYTIALLCIFYTPYLHAQQHRLDSLTLVLQSEKDDTNRVKTLNDLGFAFYTSKPDSTISVSQRALALAEKLNWPKGEASAYKNEATGYYVLGAYAKAIEYYTKGLKICEDIGDKYGKAGALCNMGNVYNVQGDYAKALDLYQQALNLAQEMNNLKLQASIYTNTGAIYYMQGDYTKALDYDMKSLGIHEKLGNKSGQATVLGNIGGIYSTEGDYLKGLDYYLKALNKAEELGDAQLEVKNLTNIGIIYTNLGNFPKALNYDDSSLNLSKKLGNKQMQANNIANIGSIYFEIKDYPKSLEADLEALELAKETGDKRLEANSLSNTGNVYWYQGNYSQAFNYYDQALKIAEELNDKDEIARVNGSIGDLFVATRKYPEAEEYLKKAIAMDSSTGQLADLSGFEAHLSKLYNVTGRFKEALEWYQKAVALNDSLFNLEKNKALTRKELTYEYDKKEALARAEQDKKDAIAGSERRKQAIVTFGVTICLLLALAFALLIYRSLRITRNQKKLIEIKNEETGRQKTIIEQQKAEVEEKNKDILDSITYAKRLQDAILPPLSIIKKYLPDSFVLYKPKDIVAGDFYWMEREGDTILIAACDCTGHGVPGALVSVVCSNALNRALKEFKIRDTGQLLDKVRELVLETFERSEGEVKDGMDISFCAIDTKTNLIEWSGAYNPLWYVQNGELKELTADKQPIGKYDNPKPFNTHKLNLQKGDSLYLFTDGYADQFGGEKGKKFKYRRLQEKLMTMAALSMEQQHKVLEDTLEQWKGDLQQVDDVLVMGIRI